MERDALLKFLKLLQKGMFGALPDREKPVFPLWGRLLALYMPTNWLIDCKLMLLWVFWGREGFKEPFLLNLLPMYLRSLKFVLEISFNCMN